MAILPGSPKERTIEGILLEVATVLQRVESNELYNPDKKNLINVIIDSDTKIATITARLPIDFFINGQGQQVYKAREYTYPNQVIPPEEFMTPPTT